MSVWEGWGGEVNDGWCCCCWGQEPEDPVELLPSWYTFQLKLETLNDVVDDVTLCFAACCWTKNAHEFVGNDDNQIKESIPDKTFIFRHWLLVIFVLCLQYDDLISKRRVWNEYFRRFFSIKLVIGRDWWCRPTFLVFQRANGHYKTMRNVMLMFF